MCQTLTYNRFQYSKKIASYMYTVPKEIDFPQFNMKCSGENVILCGIFHVCRMMFSILHFMFYRGNLDYFSEGVN